MKFTLILFSALMGVSCGHAQQEVKIPKDLTTKDVQAGLQCHDDGISGADSWYPNGTLEYDLKQHVKWRIPYNQIWKCKDDKWQHDLVDENNRAVHQEAVAKVREAITRRRLTAKEIPLVEESMQVSYTPNIACYDEATETAMLIAQLSLWNPSESELPLKMLESYVKGMNCDAGTQRAYEIMNQRIIDWLKKAVRGD